MPLEQGMRIYYCWQVTTLTHERFYTSIAIAGFLCLAVAAVFLRDLPARDRALARIGSFTIGAGALLWITGAGMLAFAVTAAREHAAYRAWAVYTIVVALTLLVLAWSYAAGNGSLSDLLLTADGLLLLPLWLIWTGRIGGIGPESPSAA